jgi:hypothetical protein
MTSSSCLVPQSTNGRQTMDDLELLRKEINNADIMGGTALSRLTRLQALTLIELTRSTLDCADRICEALASVQEALSGGEVV